MSYSNVDTPRTTKEIKKGWDRFDLKIEGYTPNDIPFDLLAKYLIEFSHMLREQGDTEVQFLELLDGSCQIATAVPQIDNTIRRTEETISGKGNSKASKHFEKLRETLQQYNKEAFFHAPNNNLIIRISEPFEFVSELKAGSYTVHQVTTIDGIIEVIGDKSKNSELTTLDLRSNNGFVKCSVPLELATQIAPLLKQKVRLSGDGKWHRAGYNSPWELKFFEIHSFTELKSTSIIDLFKSMV